MRIVTEYFASFNFDLVFSSFNFIGRVRRVGAESVVASHLECVHNNCFRDNDASSKNVEK